MPTENIQLLKFTHVHAQRKKLSYERDQLYPISCRSAQTFSTRRHKLKLQLVAVSSDGPQGKSKRRRLLCYAGRDSPSRQLDDFEIVMLNSSFIQTRRPVTQASLLFSLYKGQGLIQTLSACLLQ